MTNWNDRLLELARAQARVQARNQELKGQINALYDAQIRALEDEIKANEAQLEALEAALKADALAEFESTGDLDLHEKITVQRRWKLVYDKDEALRAVEDHGALNLVRVKKELNAREFERLYHDGHLPWAPVEKVPAPVIALARLGDLLIEDEVTA